MLKKYTDGQVLLVNKPLRWTSFDIVNKLNFQLRCKVGHAGTLDPLASGLLIICCGKFTKRISEFQNQEKEYTGTFFLGATTPSFDLETKPENFLDITNISEQQIIETTKTFSGEILQSPPAYSSVKKDGERMYYIARRGEKFDIEKRKVQLTEFEITKIELPLIHFRIVCGKGFYVRSLADDFGKALNNGAYLASLCRTRIGSYSLKDAVEIDALIEQIKEEKKAGHLSA